ncbi:hypothetical protein [Oceanispirochaeta sp.]|uniref:hypothetical protein n=1 Tax=Oceanispirochaeta sp. TaxID=2035350 RepID=UPI00261865D2|nr:hypothetical protein [Oceanispirochaeta sp.]MDA3958344.1 hypothetical protein [Oceanispirochaeta sp.]
MSEFPFLPLDPEPCVGIFWSYQNSLFHAESSLVTRGMSTSISVDYKVGHYAAWFLMQKRGILDKLPPSYRSEYDMIPRGRVVYLFRKKKFVIYHGDDFTERECSDIKSIFSLPEEWTIDDVDMHYNPLPEDFEF